MMDELFVTNEHSMEDKESHFYVSLTPFKKLSKNQILFHIIEILFLKPKYAPPTVDLSNQRIFCITCGYCKQYFK